MLRHGHGTKYSPVPTPSQTFSSGKSQTFQTSKSMSDASLTSAGTKSSGPTKKEPPLITSTWKIGWRVPTHILSCYAAAIAIALAHLILFKYIDGKQADGPHRVAPQSYITTASNILANTFGFALRASLSVVFVQYLWHLLRVQTMKVSTIELLFAIRSNPFQIFRMATLAATPTLCLLATFIWALQIITSFPPGAITVITAQQASYETLSVPTFNASFMGNASGADANANSLITLELDPPSGFQSGDFHGDKSTNLINRLARQVLITGQSFPMQSPCGVNCSYTLHFEGPYTECSTNSSTAVYTNITDLAGYWAIYSGQWISPATANLVQSLYNGTYTLAHLNATTLTPLSITTNDTDGSETLTSVTIQADNTICTPGRANYTVQNTWLNNVYSRNVTRVPVDTLINLELLTHDSVVVVPGFVLNGTYNYGTAPANWSAAALAFYRDNNYMAMFDAMMSWLDGEFLATISHTQTESLPLQITYEAGWDEQMETFTNGVTSSNGEQNGTVIDNTRFNSIFDTYTNLSHPQFNISEDIFNDYLLNMTMSAMQAYSRWSTSANVTKDTAINVYSFSAPLNLIIPYFLTLVLSIPFIILGGVALYWNGVSAMDGGFMQIITTSTGSAVLDRAAAGGCLGGNESVPQELKDLEIRFGEIVGRDDAPVKRAGFGIESETTLLKKGASYGIARWI